MKPVPTLVLALLCLPCLGSCASVLTRWHDDSYVSVLDPHDPEVEPHHGNVELTEGDDMDDQAEALYAQGYVLLGFSKFTHTLVPRFNAMYAKMYGEKLGAEVVMQQTPKKVGGNVYAYLVTYWARGRDFPFGAYYNDVPDDTRLYYPDSLRAFLDGGRPVLVEEVVEQSPAALAGVRPGELVVGLDGEPLQGAEDLDRRLIERSGKPTEVQLWGPDGLRTASLQLGQVASSAGAKVPGAEALFYRDPWELHDYQDFSYISHAFQQAVNDAIESYKRQQEAARQQAYEAWQNARITQLEHQDVSTRPGTIPRRGGDVGRMGIPVGNGLDFAVSGGNDLGSAYAGLATDWYFTHKDMWVPTGGMGSQWPF